MKKNLGVKPAIFPMPVLLIATYNEDGSVDVMNAAWGMMVDMGVIALNLTESHKTVENIKKRGAFTVALANKENLVPADYVGIVSANNTPDKFLKTTWHANKSEFVDAPVISELPITMECVFIEYQDSEYGCGVIGEIKNVLADESVLESDGSIDVAKINAIMYDPFNHGYYSVGSKVGQAFQEGNKLK